MMAHTEIQEMQLEAVAAWYIHASYTVMEIMRVQVCVRSPWHDDIITHTNQSTPSTTSPNSFLLSPTHL